MNIFEAEMFYKRYLGQIFHMGREEYSTYQRFRELNISDDQIGIWDEDLLEQEFGRLWEEPENIWIHHENILTILRRGSCRVEHYAARLLDEMERMTALDEMNLILIIENMAGRDMEMRSGGCSVFCKMTKLASRMLSVMQSIIASAPSEPATLERLESAIRRYHLAVSKYCHLNQ